MSKDRSSLESMSQDDEYEAKIDLFFPFLQETLRASHLLCLIRLKEVDKVSHKIHRLENENQYGKAAEELLNAIKRSDEPGKWQMFIDAVREDGACIVLERLFEEEMTDTWHTEHHKMIGIFARTMELNLNLNAILERLLQADLIIRDDYEKLKAMTGRGETRSAIGLMLILIHRRNPDWYKAFLTILIEKDFLRLAEEIDPDKCDKILREKGWKKEDPERIADTDFGTGGSRGSSPYSASAGEGASPFAQSNLGKDGAKTIGDKSLGLVTKGAATGESTCTCQGCSHLIAEVVSLRHELTNVVASLKSEVAQVTQLKSELGQVAALKSEMAEMKKLLLALTTSRTNRTPRQ